MENVQHTPTPWQTLEGADGAWFIWNGNGGISTKDLIACCVGRVNPDHRDPKVAATDAAFIVHACNAHDFSVEVLKDLRGFIEACIDGEWDSESNGTNWPQGLKNKLQIALAKAEGR